MMRRGNTPDLPRRVRRAKQFGLLTWLVWTTYPGGSGLPQIVGSVSEATNDAVTGCLRPC